jgi:hypothetical protein
MAQEGSDARIGRDESASRPATRLSTFCGSRRDFASTKIDVALSPGPARLIAIRALRSAPTSLREADGLDRDSARASLAVVVERRKKSTLAFCAMTIDSEAGLSGYSPTASRRSVVKIAHD